MLRRRAVILNIELFQHVRQRCPSVHDNLLHKRTSRCLRDGSEIGDEKGIVVFLMISVVNPPTIETYREKILFEL